MTSRQPVRRVHVNALDLPACYRIAQLLQRRPLKVRAAPAIIHVAVVRFELKAIGGDALLQRRDLTVDRVYRAPAPRLIRARRMQPFRFCSCLTSRRFAISAWTCGRPALLARRRSPGSPHRWHQAGIGVDQMLGTESRLSNDTRTICSRGRSVRRTMRPSIDGGSRIKPPMPHQFVRKYSALCGKLTRLASNSRSSPALICCSTGRAELPSTTQNWQDCTNVPWRFSDAGQRSVRSERRCQRPKTCTLPAALRTRAMQRKETSWSTRRNDGMMAWAPTGHHPSPAEHNKNSLPTMHLAARPAAIICNVAQIQRNPSPCQTQPRSPAARARNRSEVLEVLEARIHGRGSVKGGCCGGAGSGVGVTPWSVEELMKVDAMCVNNATFGSHVECGTVRSDWGEGSDPEAMGLTVLAAGAGENEAIACTS